MSVVQPQLPPQTPGPSRLSPNAHSKTALSEKANQAPNSSPTRRVLGEVNTNSSSRSGSEQLSSPVKKQRSGTALATPYKSPNSLRTFGSPVKGNAQNVSKAAEQENRQPSASMYWKDTTQSANKHPHSFHPYRPHTKAFQPSSPTPNPTFRARHDTPTRIDASIPRLAHQRSSSTATSSSIINTPQYVPLQHEQEAHMQTPVGPPPFPGETRYLTPAPSVERIDLGIDKSRFRPTQMIPLQDAPTHTSAQPTPSPTNTDSTDLPAVQYTEADIVFKTRAIENKYELLPLASYTTHPDYPTPPSWPDEPSPLVVRIDDEQLLEDIASAQIVLPMSAPAHIPEGWYRQDSAPLHNGNDGNRPSPNIWDYIPEKTLGHGTGKGQKKSHFRNPQDIRLLEAGIEINTTPGRSAKTRFGTWMGRSARGIEIWCQNRRGDMKKQAVGYMNAGKSLEEAKYNIIKVEKDGTCVVGDPRCGKTRRVLFDVINPPESRLRIAKQILDGTIIPWVHWKSWHLAAEKYGFSLDPNDSKGAASTVTSTPVRGGRYEPRQAVTMPRPSKIIAGGDMGGSSSVSRVRPLNDKENSMDSPYKKTKKHHHLGLQQAHSSPIRPLAAFDNRTPLGDRIPQSLPRIAELPTPTRPLPPMRLAPLGPALASPTPARPLVRALSFGQPPPPGRTTLDPFLAHRSLLDTSASLSFKDDRKRALSVRSAEPRPTSIEKRASTSSTNEEMLDAASVLLDMFKRPE